MSDKARIVPQANPPRQPDTERAETVEAYKHPKNAASEDPRHRPARPGPQTGEVPAGPGDAGLEHHPVVNAGSPGTRQMSNSRLGMGLALAVLLAVIVLFFAVVF